MGCKLVLAFGESLRKRKDRQSEASWARMEDCWSGMSAGGKGEMQSISQTFVWQFGHSKTYLQS